MLFVYSDYTLVTTMDKLLKVAMHKKNMNRYLGLHFKKKSKYIPIYVGY